MSHDACGLNALIKSATDSGVLIVKSAGNYNSQYPNQCNTSYPSQRPETLSVSALDNVLDSYPYIYPRDYRDTYTADYSSRGGIVMMKSSGVSGTVDVVDLTAPGERRFWFTGTSTYSDTYDVERGTSFATAVVSGSAAAMRQIMYDQGWSSSNARQLMANLLLLGDGLRGRSSSYYYNYSVDRNTGFGRLRAHWPSSTSLTAPWGWGTRRFDLNEGETATYTVGGTGPESSLITGWKWAIVIKDLSPIGVYDSSPSDVIVRVVDTCPPGGGSPVVVRTSATSDIYRKRIRLSQAEISGRCLQMEVEAVDSPHGVRIYSADYYHGGDNTLH